MNFAIMRSGFGDYWIGKTELPVKDGSIFSTLEDALDQAKSLNDSIENQDELDATTEEDVEEVDDAMVERWGV